jgi:hypothetical protein
MMKLSKELRDRAKRKFWIPFERRSRFESDILDGESMEEPWESLFHQQFGLFYGPNSNLHGGVCGGGRGRREGVPWGEEEGSLVK